MRSVTATWFPASIALALAAFVLLGWWWFDYAPTVMWFPMLVAALTILLCLLYLVRQPRPDVQTETPPGERPMYLEAREFALAVAILPLVWLFGFVAGAAFFLAFFVRVHGESWLWSIGLGLAGMAVVQFGFVMLLDLHLPAGVLGW